jgi:hypothetical protein
VARLFADENFPLPAVEALRSLGHDVLTIHETGKSGQGLGDEDVLDMSVSHRCAVLTLNRKHFMQLHRRRPHHAGIIVCTVDDDFVALARRIHSAICADPELDHKLIRVYRQGPDEPEGSERVAPD